MEQENIRIDRFADLLTNLIEKYAGQLNINDLPDVKRPESKSLDYLIKSRSSGLFFCLVSIYSEPIMQL